MNPWRSSWLIGGVSLALRYAVASLTFMNRWIGMWLRIIFCQSSVLFRGIVVTLCGLIIHRYHRRPLQAEAIIILGVLQYIMVRD